MFMGYFNATLVRSSVCDVFATNGSKNMGEGRAESRTAYAVLYAPTTAGRRAQRGATERSEFEKTNRS